jgi:hypothetical protein
MIIYLLDTALMKIIDVITWIVVAILYRVGKTGDDLWGWACSPVAERIQPGFEGLVNFGSVCSRGVSYCEKCCYCNRILTYSSRVNGGLHWLVHAYNF